VNEGNFVFRREGEYWTIVFGGELIRLRDSKGVRYLAALIRQPGRPVEALELVAGAAQTARHASPSARPLRVPATGQRGPEAERARLTVTKGLKATLRRIADLHPSFAAHLHATVRRGYACIYLPDPCHPVSWQQ
jgi:hypothetical protein